MGRTKVTINGTIPTSGKEGQFWQLKTGPFAPEVPIIVDAKTDSEFQNLPNPITLTVTGSHRENLKTITTNATYQDLFLTRRHSVSQGHRIRWYITDVRSFLKKLWVFSDFSIRRPLNEFLPGFGVGGQQDFHRTPKLGYIPHTNRNTTSPDDDPAFASGDTDVEIHKPWTAKQAVLWMLKGFFRTESGRVQPTGLPQGWTPRVVDGTKGEDNGRLLVDYRTNKPWPIVMKDLLQKAHMTMHITEKGEFFLDSLEAVTLPSRVGGYSKGGSPIYQDASRSRPTRVRVFFRTERELRFNFLETSSEVTDTSERGKRSINLDLENVMILPQDVRELSSGKIYQRGTVVTIPKGLELWNQDPDNPPPRAINKDNNSGQRIQFNLQLLRDNIMSPALATRMLMTHRYSLDKDQVFAARASVLYSSYRQLFRIPPVWLDMCERFRLERTAIMDQISGKRAPSPVYMDYFQELSARYFHYKGSPSDQKAGLNVRAWGGALATTTDFNQLPLVSGQPSPYKIGWVNRRQGVFRVAALPDLYGNTIRFIPAIFAGDKVPVTRLGGVGNTWHMHQMIYESFFRLSTIISATMRTPNNHKKLYFIDYDKTTTPATSTNATGPAHETLFSTTHAGIAWLDQGQVDPLGKVIAKSVAKVISKNGVKQVEVSGGALTNPTVLEDAAAAVLKDVEFKHADRMLGTFAAPGHDIDEDYPGGQVTSVTLRHQNGRIESIYNCEQPPVAPPLWENLPQATQNFLFRIEGDPNP